MIHDMIQSITCVPEQFSSIQDEIDNILHTRFNTLKDINIAKTLVFKDRENLEIIREKFESEFKKSKERWIIQRNHKRALISHTNVPRIRQVRTCVQERIIVIRNILQTFLPNGISNMICVMLFGGNHTEIIPLPPQNTSKSGTICYKNHKLQSKQAFEIRTNIKKELYKKINRRIYDLCSLQHYLDKCNQEIMYNNIINNIII